jgi:Uncharacterized protein conserved in bacteria
VSKPSTADKSLLGQATPYCKTYDPGILFPIPRQEKRDELGFDLNSLPFQGLDIWTAYEVSWLNAKGKPVAVIAEFAFPADSPNLIESKSFKLYLNSFNGTRFSSQQEVEDLWVKDLSAACGGEVQVDVRSLNSDEMLIGQLPGENLDDLDIEVDTYQVKPELLSVEVEVVEETLNSHLLNPIAW